MYNPKSGRWQMAISFFKPNIWLIFFDFGLFLINFSLLLGLFVILQKEATLPSLVTPKLCSAISLF